MVYDAADGASWATCHAPRREDFCASVLRFRGDGLLHRYANIQLHPGGLPQSENSGFRFQPGYRLLKIKEIQTHSIPVLVKLQFTRARNQMRPRRSLSKRSLGETRHVAPTRCRAHAHPPSDSRDVLEWSLSGGVPETDGVGLKAGHQFACPSAR